MVNCNCEIVDPILNPIFSEKLKQIGEQRVYEGSVLRKGRGSFLIIVGFKTWSRISDFVT